MSPIFTWDQVSRVGEQVQTCRRLISIIYPSKRNLDSGKEPAASVRIDNRIRMEMSFVFISWIIFFLFAERLFQKLNATRLCQSSRLSVLTENIANINCWKSSPHELIFPTVTTPDVLLHNWLCCDDKWVVALPVPEHIAAEFGAWKK